MKKIKRSTGEGGVYRCRWRLVRGYFKVECVEPVLQIRADSLAEGEAAMHAAIMSATGDGEPFIEFDPPLPSATAAGRTRPEYFGLGWNDSVSWVRPRAGEGILHKGGICPRCAIGLGSRTTVRREIVSAPRYDFAGFYRDRTLGIMISARACERLLEHAKNPVERVEVIFSAQLKRPTKQKYFELAMDPGISSVYPKDIKISSGWKCPHCGRSNLFATSKLAGAARYSIRRSDAVGDILLVQKGPWVAIAISKDLRQRLARDRFIKGLVTERIAVLEEDEIMPAAKIPFAQLKDIQV